MNARLDRARSGDSTGRGSDRLAIHPDRAARMRGTAIVFVSIAIVSCLAFAVLTLDVGMIVMTKIQLQNAADAAALAGASALRNGDQAEARRRAIAVAGQNLAWRNGLQPVVISNADVTFPTATRCRVRTHRTHETGDPLRTFFIGVLDPGSDRLADASALAEAEFADLCGSSCFKPWSPVDRWNDVNNNGQYDYGESYTDSNNNGQYDLGEPYNDANRNFQRDPDEPYDPVTTGYHPSKDVGTRITLKLGNSQDAITPGHFYAVDLPPLHDPSGTPPGTGGSTYRDYIANCAPFTVDLGDSLQVETGNMVGPTRQGALDLISQDPTAYWDNATQTIQGSAYGTSPRVCKLALFNPRYTPKSGRNFVVVSKLGAFFIETVGPGSNVRGVYMGLTTTGNPCTGGEPTFLTGLRLIE